MFKNILVALDGSKHAKRATVAATDLAQRYRSKLRFITVVKPPPPRVTTELRHYMEIENLKGTPTQFVSDAVQKILNEAEQHAKKKGLKDVKTVVQEGPAARSIVGYAKRQGVDLIVMGSRGLGTAERMLLGSVSHKVANLADCAVMTVR
jgi:nucleotide-binding universal stress UspA family protein